MIHCSAAAAAAGAERSIDGVRRSVGRSVAIRSSSMELRLRVPRAARAHPLKSTVSAHRFPASFNTDVVRSFRPSDLRLTTSRDT